MSRWVSLCCGLDAAASLAMAGGFVPIPRMGSKRGYAEQILGLLGTWPMEFLMIDACPAIVSFWQHAFTGRLPEVAEIIAGYELDGEELWRDIVAKPVPADPLEQLAAWIIVQKGNFSGKPAAWTDDGWKNRSYNPPTGLVDWKADGYGSVSEAARALGFTERVRRDLVAAKLAEWSGVAGFVTESKSSRGNWANKTTIDTGKLRAKLAAFAPGVGSAQRLDLSTEAPLFRPGDLVTIDPPYVGTQGYGKAKMTRERVRCLAEIANATGCRVLVHEAEPVLFGGPWNAVELTRSNEQDTWRRRGKRGREEWVVVNFEPADRIRRSYAQITGPLFDEAK